MKLLFDENFGRPLVDALKGLMSFAREKPEISHILALQQPGVKDSEWIPRLADDKWIVLTGDRGKSAGPKLPQLCRAYGITHVLLSGSLQSSPQFEKARAVIGVWPALLALPDAPAGTRFALRYSHHRQAMLILKP